MHLINDALQLISKANIPRGALIFGNVPSRLEKNYNNEIVFEAPWDFTAALSIFTNRLVAGGPVIDAKKQDFHYLRISNDSWDIHGFEKTGFDNLWFYNYDPQEKKGSLKKINDAYHLKSTLAPLGFPFYLGQYGKSSDLKKNQTIYFADDWQNREQFTKRGFAHREGWGVWSSGNEVELSLPLPIDGSQFLELDLRAFVSKEKPNQRIVIKVDGLKQYQFSLNNFDKNLIQIPITTSEKNSGQIVNLKFHLLDAISPRDLGIAPDDRVLAIGFKSATFK